MTLHDHKGCACSRNEARGVPGPGSAGCGGGGQGRDECHSNRGAECSVDEEDADGLWATEIWESEEAHDASLQIDRVREQIGRAMPLLEVSGIRQQRLQALSGVPD